MPEIPRVSKKEPELLGGEKMVLRAETEVVAAEFEEVKCETGIKAH